MKDNEMIPQDEKEITVQTEDNSQQEVATQPESAKKNVKEFVEERIESRHDYVIKKKQISLVKTFFITILGLAVIIASIIIIPKFINLSDKTLDAFKKVYDDITGKIIIPCDSDVFKNKDSEYIKDRLSAMKFKDVETKDVPVQLGIILRPGIVNHVEIAGNNNFQAGKEFKKSDKVVIYKYVYAESYKINRLVAGIAAVIFALCLSLIITKRKKGLTIVLAVVMVLSIAGSALYVFILPDSMKRSFFDKEYNVEINITSKDSFIFNDYDIAVKLDGEKQGITISDGQTTSLGVLKLKNGKHEIEFYNNTDNNINGSSVFELTEDAAIDFVVTKKSDSIEVEMKPHDFVKVEETTGPQETVAAP